MSSKANGDGLSSPSQQVDIVKQLSASTTFVQAQKESFREVVQKYTGAGDDAQGKLPVTSKPVGMSNGAKDVAHRKPAFRLHERRQKGGKEMKLEIKHNSVLFKRNGASPRSEGLSPTLNEHVLPPLLSSPVTPLSALTLDSSPRTPYDQRQPKAGSTREESKLDLDRFLLFAPLQPRKSEPELLNESKLELDRFTLYAPVQPRKTEPELLNLFPLTSPRMSEISKS